MIEKKDVEHLANLARIEFDETEFADLQKDLDSILTYVDQVKEVSFSVDLEPEVGVVYNVLREDTNAYEDGESQKEIVNSFPEKEAGYLKVKKILS